MVLSITKFKSWYKLLIFLFSWYNLLYLPICYLFKVKGFVKVSIFPVYTLKNDIPLINFIKLNIRKQCICK